MAPTSCENLEPLGCLEEVGTMLSIVGSDKIRSLAGLSGLRRVGLRAPNGGLAIGFFFDPWETHGNAELRTLEGLGPLERADGRFAIHDNPKLEDLRGIAPIPVLETPLWIVNNDSLASLESLRGLVSTDGLYIEDNDALVDLTG